MAFSFNFDEYKNCKCGVDHNCNIKDIEIGPDLRYKVGEILDKNNFPKRVLVVCDKNTHDVTLGLMESMKGYYITILLYDNLRVAKMDDVRAVEKYIDLGMEGVISIGTGSLCDPARLACFRKNVPFCIFATAPSMDGFASNSAPIVDNNFKITYQAKCPDVIIADTKILASSPKELKSAGFGDMVAKYVALIDWKVSHIVSNEICCDKVYELTRYAVDRVMDIAERVTLDDEESASLIFEGLLLTGIAMSFTGTSRPGSGTEHIMAHFIECKELLKGKIPNYHGEDVGVMTLIVLKFYNEIAKYKGIKAHKENIIWDDVYKAYGELKNEVIKLNTPDTITDSIDPKILEDKFEEIKEIIRSVPSYERVLEKMKIAGCKTTIEEIGKDKDLIDLCFKYHPYMRRRLSLLRLSKMFEEIK